MKILIIDDDEKLDKEFVKNAELAGFTADFAKDVNVGIAKLATQKIDVAILDLDFGVGQLTGESLIKTINELCLRVPVIIHSGRPDSAYAYEDKTFGIFKRGCEYSEIFDRLREIERTGICEILGSAGKFENILQTYYESFFLNRKHMWISRAALDSDRVKSSLTRAFSYLLEDEIHHDGKAYNEEFYLIAKDTVLCRGSILKKLQDGANYIVMTPACDLVLRDYGKPKVKSITLCLIEGIERHGLSISGSEDISEEDRNQKVHPLFSNSNADKEAIRYHWIPQIDSFDGGIINFSKVISVPYSKIEKDFEITRFKVAQPYIKNIVSRFSSYFARQGQPDLASTEFENSLKWTSNVGKMSP